MKLETYLLAEHAVVEFDNDWDELPIAELHQLDAMCDQFEQAFVLDSTTRIEAFVVGLAEPQQRLLVRELVQLEIERRSTTGQTPTPDEYALRFPQWADEIRVLAAQRIEDLNRTTIAVAAVESDTVDDIASPKSDTNREISAAAAQSAHASDWQASMSRLSRADLPADGVLGHYRLQSVIGRGGMGLVVRAHDTKLGRDVAIKILAPEISHDAQPKERFLREARAVAVIRHNHVVTIYAVEEFRGISFLVMELVDGTTLEEHLKSNDRRPPEEVAGLALQIAQGLAAAHKHGLVHRDVKPANILLEKVDQHGSGLRPASKWHVRITDFGLARVAAESRLTSSGLIAGTPQYMSPEQANGQELDARSDLFSLGSVMYTMCGGRAAFQAESAVGILRQVADKPAHSLREVNPETPDWLAAIIEKLMAKSPDERIQSAVEVAELLGRHVQDFHAGESLPDLLPVLETPTDVVVPVSHRSRTAVLIAVVIVGIAIVASGIGKLVQDDKAHQARTGRVTTEVAGLTGIRGSAENPRVSRHRPNSNATEIDRAFLEAGTPQADQPEAHAAGNATPGQSHHDWPADAPPPASVPFTAEQARQHQEAWAGHLGVEVATTNSSGMQFQLIPPGEFMMGCSEKEIRMLLEEAAERKMDSFYISRIPIEGPQHHVTLTQPFTMSTHEVTRGLFRQFVEATAYETDAENDGIGGGGWQDGAWVAAPEFLWNTPLGFAVEQTDEHPVVNVSWNDAVAFCNWLSEKEGVTYRLPTEAEWEYACRAGSIARYSCGDEESHLDDHAWHEANGRRSTNPVARKKQNALGLFDMHGNAFEWCQDRWYGLYSKTFAIDPTASVAFGVDANIPVTDRLLRGGSFANPAAAVRSTFRRSGEASLRNAYIGFRVAADVPRLPATKANPNTAGRRSQ